MSPPDRLTAALADRYRIERELGHGGMATVYLATDLRHHRQVAIKLLRPELSAILGAERFLHEIKVTANLQHPHIVPLFDSGEAEGLLWYAMPYLGGESLRTRLDREKQLPVDDAVRITREAASALEYAHKHSVIHRDIKPENILLLDGAALVADFGIALAVSSAGGNRLTETGLSLGTPFYMSPEQAMGDRAVDARSDVYSLGAVLYEMLSGDPPHTGSTAQAVVTAVITEPTRDVRLRRPKVPEHVARAVHRAIEKLPADRFPSAAAFSEALDRPDLAPVLAAAPAARRPLLLAGVAGLALGALAAVLLLPVGTRHAGGTQGEVRNQLTFTGRAVAPALSPDGQFVAYVEKTCRHGPDQACSSTLLVQEVGTTRPVPLLRDALSLDLPRWTHDGEALVVAAVLDSARAGVFAMSRLGGAPQRLADWGVIDTHPSGDTILVVQSRGPGRAMAKIVATASGALVDTFSIPLAAVRSVAWDPSGRWVAAGRSSRIVVLDRRGHITASTALRSRGVVHWDQAGDGLLVFQVGRGREDELIRLAVDDKGRFRGPPSVLLSRVPTLYEGEFDLARKSGRVVVATGSAIHDEWVFDLDRGPAVGQQVTRGTTWYGIPGLSPDGNRLFFLRGDAIGDNVYAIRLSDLSEEALTALRLPGGDPVRVSADGRRLAFESISDSGYWISDLDLESGRLNRFDATGDFRHWPVGSRTIVALDRISRRLSLGDSVGGRLKPVPLPDSLEVATVVATADGQNIVVVGRVHDRSVLGLLSLPLGPWREVAHLLSDYVSLSTGPNGTVYIGAWPDADPHASVWRMTLAGGSLVKLTELPEPCSPVTITVALSGRRVACEVEEHRSDIWSIEGVGR